MNIEALTLDDLMNKVLSELLKQPFDVEPTRGKMSEITAVTLCLKNPLARLSRTETKGTPFSALGELLWYLSRKNKLTFISHYIKGYINESDNNRTIYGAYGPRLFNSNGKYNQIKNVIDLLKQNPASRRAVIQIFESRDIARKRMEIPCTCSLQFLIRDSKLNLITHMRSNDAYLGLPHDIFTFTMLQEIIARTLNVQLGAYTHFVGSLHLYEAKQHLASQYLAEGWQSTKKVMPPMPYGDPWSAIRNLLKIEKNVRLSRKVNIDKIILDDYWKDLAILLQIHKLFKTGDMKGVATLKELLSVNIYDTYIMKKIPS